MVVVDAARLAPSRIAAAATTVVNVAAPGSWAAGQGGAVVAGGQGGAGVATGVGGGDSDAFSELAVESLDYLDEEQRRFPTPVAAHYPEGDALRFVYLAGAVSAVQV